MTKILKLKKDAAEERIVNTAKKFVGENKTLLTKFEENYRKEIIARNQSKNHHLDNKLLRIRHKIKYDELLTNDRLKEWKIIDNETCSFCGTFVENLGHLLNNCEILKPLWDKV